MRGGAGLTPQHLASLPEAQEVLGGDDDEPMAERSPGIAGMRHGGSPTHGAHHSHSLEGAFHGQHSLIRQAQLAFRSRQQRKKAVRVIEGAWSEWQFHSEQAKLAANVADGAPFHAYHAERRERAARVIQGYLLREQSGAAEGAHESPNASSYSVEELELLRRLQRSFRAHVKTQAAQAEAALQATRSASEGSGDDERSLFGRLCHILRKCSLEGSAANLSGEEQAELTRLQLAVRDHLERKRQQQPNSSAAAASWSLDAEDAPGSHLPQP
jgi:hypothetical protein